VTRFINAVLISVFAFFVFLGVFWQFTGHGSQEHKPGGAATVTAVMPHWQADPTQELLLDVKVHNPSSLPGKVPTVSYQATVDGKSIDLAVARPIAGLPVTIPGKSDATVHVPVDLPDDFVVQWWPSYMAGGEAADLRIHGSLAVRRDDVNRDAPFEWHSHWQGALATSLSDAVANCDQSGGGGDLCLQGSKFFWKDGALHATLRMHNPGDQAVMVGNTTITLLFADRAVVNGNVDVAQQVPPGDDAQVGLGPTFSQSAMAAWWPDHLARCERTPVAFRMELQVNPVSGDGTSNEVTTLQWTFPAAAFQTRFACGP
jgi:LEA14-like dessication related protein